MKKFSQAIALVAVTTLFATAFTTSHFEKHASVAQASSIDTGVAQVIIVGKRMTALEKAQYDAQVLAQSSDQSEKAAQPAFRIAVK